MALIQQAPARTLFPADVSDSQHDSVSFGLGRLQGWMFALRPAIRVHIVEERAGLAVPQDRDCDPAPVLADGDRRSQGVSLSGQAAKANT